MPSKLTTFLSIMMFYILLSYILGPLAFYYFFGKNLKSAGNGFIVGSVLSIVLWYFYGSKMI
uniref:Uncharacterized protein n=1 Tax=viral metagenome TaxID=1070528 RepID=A0A6C0HD53_9ZZZZ